MRQDVPGLERHSAVEGSCCPLAKRGNSRDHRADRPRIAYGLLCNAEGCPVAVEAFPGNTADPRALSSRVNKLRQRFGLQRVVLVGDRPDQEAAALARAVGIQPQLHRARIRTPMD